MHLWFRARRKPVLVGVGSLGFAALGTFLLGFSLGLTPAASFEPEAGALAGTTQVVTDTGASGGQVVKFGTAGTGSPFVTVCGMQLCLNGQPFKIRGATNYGQYDNVPYQIDLAKSANLNTLELVIFFQDYRSLSSATSSGTWARVDKFIAAAKAKNMHVILNISEYGQALAANGQTPTTVDWNPYLSFIANRTNAETGVLYKNEPTIAMVKLLGEPDAPNYGSPTRGTTQQLTDFYQRTLAQWKALAPNILASSGGFSYINDSGSGIDWQAIVRDPNNAVCDVEINSFPDRNISVPNVSSYCQQIGKPWVLAAWSSCWRPGGAEFNGDANSWKTDAEMAAHAQDMVNIANNTNPTAPGPATAAAGNQFWSLADIPARTGSCDIGPQFPLTFNVVKNQP